MSDVKMSPILFSGPMVRAILEGRKTQTRRVVKLRKGDTIGRIYGGDTPDEWTVCGPDGDEVPFEFVCPYGSVGDRLWVRETWKVGAWRRDGRMAIDYLASPELTHTPWIYPPKYDFAKLTEESFEDCDLQDAKSDGAGGYTWPAGKSPCRVRPSLFMYRWASRLMLEITDLRIERLQDISEADAQAEGCAVPNVLDAILPKYEGNEKYMAANYYPEVYRQLWNKLNSKKHPWADNPWVWVVTFKVIP